MLASFSALYPLAERRLAMEKFEIPLGIPGVKIDRVEERPNGDFVITVTSSIVGTQCRRCGRTIDKFHGHDREIELRHLSILGRKTYIRIRPARYQCPYCDEGPTTTQKTSWYHPGSRQTKAYEKHILLTLINGTVKDVSIKEGIGYEAAMGIIDRHIGRKVDWNEIHTIEVLGLDEISLKKGHKDFVTLVTVRTGGNIQILAVLKDRKKSTVKKFLKTIPRRLRRQLVAVCSDMYEAFINAAKEVLGSKIIVIDRFHVAQLYRKGLEGLRKKELKRLKSELSEEDYQKLKGAMWALRKKKEDLSEEESTVLAHLFSLSPKLKVAYDLCGQLTAIFDSDLTKKEAKDKLKEWMQHVRGSAVTCFDKFMSTLEKYLDLITNYFIARHTSGFVEGLNNKVKVIKRRCYGILNTEQGLRRAASNTRSCIPLACRWDAEEPK
jgi:transposase